jgi:hypothetical protein
MRTACKALLVSLIHQVNECKEITVVQVEGFLSVTTPSVADLPCRKPDCVGT